MNDNNANLILERMNNNSLSFEFVNSILKKYPDSYNQFMNYTNIVALSRIKNNIKNISKELYLEKMIIRLNNIYFDCKNIIFNDLFYGFALNDESRDFMNKLGMYDSLEYYKSSYSYIIKKYNELDDSEKKSININEIKSPSELINEVNSMISDKSKELFLGTIEEHKEKDAKRLAYATKLMSKEEIYSLYQTLKKYHNGKPKIVLDVFSNALRERFGPLTNRELEEYLGRGETYQEKKAGSRFDEYLGISRDIPRKLQELLAMFPDMEASLKDNKTPTAKK